VVHGCVDDVVAGSGPFASVVDREALCPVHGKEPHNSKDRDDGLQGYKEASKEKEVDNIDVLITHLKLHVLRASIQLILIKPKFVIGFHVVPFQKSCVEKISIKYLQNR
jgi:hypothetical protein